MWLCRGGAEDTPDIPQYREAIGAQILSRAHRAHFCAPAFPLAC